MGQLVIGVAVVVVGGWAGGDGRPSGRVPVRGGVCATVGNGDFDVFVVFVVGRVDGHLDVGDVPGALGVRVLGELLTGWGVNGPQAVQLARRARPVGALVDAFDPGGGQLPHGPRGDLTLASGQVQAGQGVRELPATDRVGQQLDGLRVVLPLGERGQVGQGQIVVNGRVGQVVGQAGGLAGGADLLASAAGRAGDR